MANKIKYGLQGVHWATITQSGSVISYGTPSEWKGAVSINMSPESSQTNFYADNGIYYSLEANSGYSGDLVTASIPDLFRTQCLGETLDAKGFYVEDSTAKRGEFALMFQFEGDENATRHIMYRCVASRPNVEGQTIEDSVTPQTETVTITAMPRLDDHIVKARCPFSSSSTSSYQLWFTTVQEPTAS